MTSCHRYPHLLTTKAFLSQNLKCALHKRLETDPECNLLAIFKSNLGKCYSCLSLGLLKSWLGRPWFSILKWEPFKRELKYALDGDCTYVIQKDWTLTSQNPIGNGKRGAFWGGAPLGQTRLSVTEWANDQFPELVPTSVSSLPLQN